MKISYDDISPITGHKCVLIEKVGENNYEKICMESGYSTNSFLNSENPDSESILQKIPDYFKSKKIVDDFGQIWVPIFLNLNHTVLFPIFEENGTITWSLVKKEPLDDSEKELYKHIENPVKADMGSGKNFNLFEEALEELYKVEYASESSSSEEEE